VDKHDEGSRSAFEKVFASTVFRDDGCARRMTVTGDQSHQFGASSARFSELLDQIYDCVLSPEGWETALGALCRELDLMHGVLGYYVGHTGEPLMRKQYGMERRWFDRMPEFGIEMAYFWGGPDRIRAYPVGEAIVHSIAQPDFDFSQNRFAREWCEPQGISDFVAMTVAADPEGVGTLVFTSSERLADIAEQRLALVRAISPHIRRVVAISRVLDLKTIEADCFRATLDALPNGIVLVDESARIVHANEAAEELFRENDAVRLSAGRIALREEAATRALTSAIERSPDAARLGQRGLGVPTSSRAGANSMVHVLPLSRGALRESLNPKAAAALFVTSARSGARVPAEALSLLYNLTPAEARICELVAQGLSPAAIAIEIGVATSTVRTHLLRVYDKTGAHRQADLVRLIDSLSMRS
jgi:DNA-binding CsgD family transcriptional regulator/PAS domain-containing protein